MICEVLAKGCVIRVQVANHASVGMRHIFLLTTILKLSTSHIEWESPDTGAFLDYLQFDQRSRIITSDADKGFLVSYIRLVTGLV